MAGRGSLGRIFVAALALSAAPSLAPAQETTGATTQLGGASSQQQAYCRQLERQLAPDWQQAANVREQGPKIEAQMAQASQQGQRAQAGAEKADCFDYFLFTKSWRDTPQCRQFHQQIDDSQRAVSALDRQRQGLSAAQDRATRQEALVAELARYQCGPQYSALLQRRAGGSSAGFWTDSEGQGPGGAVPGFENAVPGSTLRTICVRTCDGYYFPISFATTTDRIARDAQVCQSQCGGPAKLYYYPNPGGEVQQAIGLDGTPYTSLQNAFRYRKEVVSSCTCKGPAESVESVADTQPMQQPAAGVATAKGALAKGVAAPAAVEPNGEALPAGEFGTMSVEPAGADPASTN